MFQLIVAVISIALVAALAIASIFYGGDAFTQSSEKANVTTLVNQGQQISGAAQLYKTDTAKLPASIAALTDGTVKYLSVAPAPSKVATGAWTIETIGTGTAARTYATVNLDTGITGSELIKLCEEITKQNGFCVDSNKKFGFPL